MFELPCAILILLPISSSNSIAVFDLIVFIIIVALLFANVCIITALSNESVIKSYLVSCVIFVYLINDDPYVFKNTRC